jgi:hypothetical protein
MAHRDGSAIVARVRQRIEAGYWPRLHCLLLVALATAAAFLLSVLLLALGVHSMAARYGFAALGGYGCFVLLIRAWVRWKWSRMDFTSDGDFGISDVVADIPIQLPSRGVTATGRLFSGGRSGGGGAAGSWGTPRAAVSSGSSGSGISLDLDADDLVWVLVALLAAVAGFAAIAYVIWIAPALLADVAVNAAVAGKVYHGMRKREPHHWTTDVFRRTALAALVIVASATAAGYAFQRIAPDARSIGGVWQHLSSR